MIAPTAPDTVITAAGWTLIHFLWQGAVIGALFFGVMHLMRNASAIARYWLGMLALGAMLASAITTFCYCLGSASGGGIQPVDLATVGQTTVATPGLAAFWVAFEQRVELWLPWAVLAWLSGVLVISSGLVFDYLRIRRLSVEGVRSLRPELQSVVDRLTDSLGLRCAIRVLESTHVAVPMVIGWMRPVILVPPSALMGLSPLQLELIISHELAHVKRLDYLFNFLQIVVETLLFYHPVVRAVSIQVRRERENCCDDVVVAQTGDSVAYARALTEVEGLRCSSGMQLTLAATGGQLGGRVRRLVARPSDQRGATDWAGGLAMLVGSVGVALSAASWVSEDVTDHPSMSAGTSAPPVIARYQDLTTAMPSAPSGDPAIVAEPAPTDPVETEAPSRLAAKNPQRISPDPPARGEPAAASTGPALADVDKEVARREAPPMSGTPGLRGGAEPDVPPSEIAPVPPISLQKTTASTAPSPMPPADDTARSGPSSGRAEDAVRVARERITGGRLLDARQPSYPRRARINGMMGVVTVVFDVTEDGSMDDVAIVDSTARIFEKPVLKALKRWRYEPFRLDGEPVRARVTRTFQFELETDQIPLTEKNGRCRKVTGSRLCRSRAAYDDLGVVVVYNNTLD